jgi:hypothetical protein
VIKFFIFFVDSSTHEKKLYKTLNKRMSAGVDKSAGVKKIEPTNIMVVKTDHLYSKYV